jgi:DNA-binding protein HU-beta
MTKAELISKVAKEAKITKAAAAQAIDSITGTITKDLKTGEKITLTGFGTFSVANRKAKTGRNPQTGQEIRIPAGKTPKFTAGKTLKEAVR